MILYKYMFINKKSKNIHAQLIDKLYILKSLDLSLSNRSFSCKIQFLKILMAF